MQVEDDFVIMEEPFVEQAIKSLGDRIGQLAVEVPIQSFEVTGLKAVEEDFIPHHTTFGPCGRACRRLSLIQVQIIKDAKVAIDPALVSVIIEGSVGIQRNSFPPPQRRRQSLVCSAFVRPSQQFEQFVAGEIDLTLAEVGQSRQLNAGQEHVFVLGGRQSVPVASRDCQFPLHMPALVTIPGLIGKDHRLASIEKPVRHGR